MEELLRLNAQEATGEFFLIKTRIFIFLSLLFLSSVRYSS